MKNTFKNKFKKFLDIALDGELSLGNKFKKLLSKKEEETIQLILNNSDSEEEFSQKISSLTTQSVKPAQLAAVFGLLVKTELSTNYIDTTMTLLDKVEEKDIIKSFEEIIKSDNLVMCEIFLNHTDNKYKRILSLDSDYTYYLALCISSGAKNITEYLLKNDKFSNLLSYKNVGETALVSCLISNQIEITNILLSHNINLSAFKDASGNPINLDNELYKPDVIKQIQKRLIHDQLLIDLNDNKPVTSKKMKL
jgi:hypothetical protein